jgi:hypothetical protein
MGGKLTHPKKERAIKQLRNELILSLIQKLFNLVIILYF